jgi:hypothetical protein
MSEMPKRPGFFVNVGIAVKSVGLCQVQGNIPRSNPWDISLFGRVACPEMPHRFACRNVPKCPTDYGRELSSHGRQIGRMAKQCFFRLRQESVTPCELVISTPLDASFTCQRRCAARGGDDVLVGTFASIRGRSDDHGKRVGSQPCSERRGYRLDGEGCAQVAGW